MKARGAVVAVLGLVGCLSVPYEPRVFDRDASVAEASMGAEAGDAAIVAVTTECSDCLTRACLEVGGACLTDPVCYECAGNVGLPQCKTNETLMSVLRCGCPAAVCATPCKGPCEYHGF